MITQEKLGLALSYIESQAHDPQSAHAAEKTLWECVLDAIAQGQPDAAELARTALRSRDIKFDRWFA